MPEVLEDFPLEPKFVEEIDDEVLHVGKVDVEQINPKFNLVEDELNQQVRDERTEYDQRVQAIKNATKLAHNDMVKSHTKQLKEIYQEEIDAKHKVEQRQRIIEKEFKRVSDNVEGTIRA